MNNYQESRIKMSIYKIVSNTIDSNIENWSSHDFMGEVFDKTEGVSDLEYSMKSSFDMTKTIMMRKHQDLFIENLTNYIYSQFDIYCKDI